ncbi:phage repressor protein CI [Mangrovibacter sp. SLW1]
MDFSSGGKEVIERLVKAYGFTTRQALCDHLGVSKSTMATRYMRDIFPADWVLQCAMETSSSLEWLAFGRGEMKSITDSETCILPHKCLINGQLEDIGTYIFDKKFLPSSSELLVVVTKENADYICDTKDDDVRDGKWFISIDGEIVLRTLTRLPGSRIHIDGGNRSFECAINDIGVIAKVLMNCIQQK